jgi:hypothetical protein
MFFFVLKIIWSREIENGKDYEPLALDDTRLVANTRLNPTRTLLTKQTHDRIEWTLAIHNLKPSDSSNYICQLNRKPYDIYWLKRFMLTVYGKFLMHNLLSNRVVLRIIFTKMLTFINPTFKWLTRNLNHF